MTETLVIKGGTLIDGTDGDPLQNAIVIIEGSEITDVGERITIPQGAEVIDASGLTVLPGLIDGHVHLTADPGKGALELTTSPGALSNLRASKNARITLEAGFTSILGCCGWGNYADLFLREAIENGWVPGPRLWTSGPGITSSLRRAVNARFGLPTRPRDLEDGPEAMRQLARRHMGSGVDWLKVLATYAVGSPRGDPALMNLNLDELKAIVEEAHAQKKKVKVHLEGPKPTKEALEAGIDIVLHGFYIDEDDAEFMSKNSVPFIPTLAWRGELVRTGAPGQPDWYVAKAKKYGSAHLASFRRAREAGVLLAAGTDCSGGGSGGDFIRHGENAKEMSYMVKNGLSNRGALLTGTRNVAEAFGLNELIGTIEPGKLADIIIIKGDPLLNIDILQEKGRILRVIKDGVTVVENGVARPAKCSRLEPNPPGFMAEKYESEYS
jgi:imidazolonepropionase-like amidohydrolase